MTDYDQATIQLFAATRDSLKGRAATIAALIDLADGHPYPISDRWVSKALIQRGLMKSNVNEILDFIDLGLKANMKLFELTDYGQAFVKWLRQPRDLPTQMNMFEDEQS